MAGEGSPWKIWHPFVASRLPKNTRVPLSRSRGLCGVVSSDAQADIAVLLGRAVFAWLIADGDCYMKNLAVLRIAADGARNFTSVRLAPVYDTATTWVFPGFAKNHLALSLVGKRNRLSSRDFVQAGVTMGMQAETARDLVESLCDRLSVHLEDLEPISGRINRAVEIWKERVETLAD